jgi:glycine cleavage system transcriptional repressor
MSSEVFITAVGRDRPGVIAGIAGALATLDANLEDTSMTRLGGRFAMVLVVQVPDGVGVTDVETALEGPAAALHLDVSVHAADASEVVDAGGADRWTVSIHGSDHPGIVHGIAAALASLDVNVLDMRTRVVGSSDHPVYVMTLEVSVPSSVRAEAVAARLDVVAEEIGVECSLHPVDDDVL